MESIMQFTMRVATAQPTAPCAGKPHTPKVKAIDRGILTPSAPICSQVTKRGIPKLWLKVLYILKSKEGARAQASTSKYLRTSSRKISGTWVHSSQGSGKSKASTPFDQSHPSHGCHRSNAKDGG